MPGFFHYRSNHSLMDIKKAPKMGLSCTNSCTSFVNP
nr:MAG TPA: hypothetical protein [Caudoviricetes sp.]